MSQAIAGALDCLVEQVVRLRQPRWESLRSLGPVLLRHESAVRRLRPPVGVRRAWESTANHARRWHVVAFDSLDDVLDACARADLPCLAFKGADTAQRLYTDPSLRVMDDLDLLIRAEDRARFAEILERRGFARVAREPGRLGAVDDRTHREWAFRRESHGLTVDIDVHWHPIADRRITIVLPVLERIDLWHDREPRPTGAGSRPSVTGAATVAAISQIVGHPLGHLPGYLDLTLLSDRSSDATAPTHSLEVLGRALATRLFGGRSERRPAVDLLSGGALPGQRNWHDAMAVRDLLLLALGGPAGISRLAQYEFARLTRRGDGAVNAPRADIGRAAPVAAAT